MELFALLVALGIYVVRGGGAPVQQDDWFHKLQGVLAARLSGSGSQIGSVLLPAVAVQCVYLWAGHGLHGLLQFALLVVVLLFSLGRGNLGAAVVEYLERWSRGDFQAAHELVQQEVMAANGCESGVEDPAALHTLVRGRLYYRSFERLFAVIFWFILGGPAAAFAYRLALLEEKKALVGTPETNGGRLALRHWIEWVPARLLALSFALVGDFDACLRRWREVLDNTRLEAVDVLESCGSAALDLQPPAADESPQVLIARGAAELDGVEVLHRRALVVWLVIIALLTMIG